ncbi:MAG: hypothetical protein Q4D74_07275, partial [Comamonadaceae bacterium]|nr:hypothetical protein [Comamonadaceae bacterium]
MAAGLAAGFLAAGLALPLETLEAGAAGFTAVWVVEVVVDLAAGLAASFVAVFARLAVAADCV